MTNAREHIRVICQREIWYVVIAAVLWLKQLEWQLPVKVTHTQIQIQKVQRRSHTNKVALIAYTIYTTYTAYNSYTADTSCTDLTDTDNIIAN